jgi:predicted RNase H-like nuclease
MSTLLVGFDSAWTANNTGAIVGLVVCVIVNCNRTMR